MTTNPASSGPRQVISVVDAVSFFVGIVVGIGIFRFSPLVAMNTANEYWFIGAWLAGGVATLIGALCYAEIAASKPNTGGEYHFLSSAYGRNVAVLFAWARCTVIQTGAIALVAFVFADYAAQLIPLGPYSTGIWAAVSIIGITLINIAGTMQGKATQIFFAIATVALVLIVALAGLMFSPSAPAPAPNATLSSGALGLAMVFVLLTYGGWNEIAYLSGEMRDVKRDMLRACIWGTLVVTVLYLAVNLAYLKAFGFAGLRDSKAVGADLMRVVAGDKGAILLSIVVCAAALSTLNATIFTGARVYYSLGRDIPAFAKLAAWDERGGNPLRAFVLQAVIALALVAFGAMTRDGLSTMVDYTSPVFWFFLMLVAISLFIFRIREPGLTRPFRVPLYPVLPGIFVLICAYLLWSSLAYTGKGALAGIGILALGLPLLLLAKRGDAGPQ
ncbi:MAG: amino acid permease [Alphaproteobacteria bacterium]|nr:amino acid permease [Alphaproteobacteria bacterium]